MANTISFSGVGSGIDFNTIRDAIITQRSRPVTLLQTKVGNYNNRVDALKQFNGLLATLTTATQNLTSRDVGTGRSPTVADATIATATGSSSASLGSFNLAVTRLATSLTQASRSFSSADAPVLAGGASNATFELRTGGANSGIEITIDATNNTLAGLRDAINAKNAGVTAGIVDLTGDGTQQQLVLSSTATGAGGRVELVETSATGTAASLNLRALNPPDGDFATLDASFSINGLNLTRPTNDVSDAVAGLNITLKKAGSTSIEVVPSSEIEEKLTAYTTAFNAVQDFIGEQYTKDSLNRPTGILAGDPALRNVQRQLSSLGGIRSTDNGGALESLAQIGITSDKNGHLEFDKTTLSERLQANTGDVRALLFGKTADETGVFQSSFTITNGLSDSITGSVQTAISGYQSSVKTLNNTIANRTETLNRMRDSLSRRFAAADAAIGQLNGQGTSLTGIIKSLQSSSS